MFWQKPYKNGKEREMRIDKVAQKGYDMRGYVTSTGGSAFLRCGRYVLRKA